MTHLIVLLACLGGFAGLALGVGRQQEVVCGRELSGRATQAWRCAGTVLLASALWVTCTTHHWGLGLVVFGGQTSLAAGLIYLGLIALQRRSSGNHERSAS